MMTISLLMTVEEVLLQILWPLGSWHISIIPLNVRFTRYPVGRWQLFSALAVMSPVKA